MNLFGRLRKKPSPQINPHKSIEVLSDAIDTLQKREIHLHKQSDTALRMAREKSKAKDKRGALFQLRRKKMFEKELDSIVGKKQNMEIQKLTIETAIGNQSNLKSLKDAQHTLSTLVDEKTVEDTDDVLSQIEETMAMGDELNDLLTRPLGPVYDDSDLLEELEEMDNGEQPLDTLNEDGPVNSQTQIEKPKEPQEPQENQEEQELEILQTELA